MDLLKYKFVSAIALRPFLQSGNLQERSFINIVLC